MGGTGRHIIIGIIGRYHSDQLEKLDNFGFPVEDPNADFLHGKSSYPFTRALKIF